MKTAVCGIFSNKKFLFLLTYNHFSSKFRYNSDENINKFRFYFRKSKGDMMKKVTLLLLSVLLTALCACAAGAPKSLKEALTACSWKAELSEGTTAVYTFKADGTFRCDASAVLDGKTANITKSGVYTVDEDENTAAVHLQYENAEYIVDISCTKNAQGYQLSIAGCDLQPVKTSR